MPGLWYRPPCKGGRAQRGGGSYHPLMLIETLGAARDMDRLNTILGVLIRHGFGETVRRLGLSDSLERAGHALKWDHAADLPDCRSRCRCVWRSKNSDRLL